MMQHRNLIGRCTALALLLAAQSLLLHRCKAQSSDWSFAGVSNKVEAMAAVKSDTLLKRLAGRSGDDMLDVRQLCAILQSTVLQRGLQP